MSELYSRLHSTATIRISGMSADIKEMREMAALYDGNLPAEYDQYFPKGTPRHIVSFIGLASDDLSQSVARAPEIQVDPMNSSDTALRKASKLEKITQAYFTNARPSNSMFLFQNAFNLVTLGRACSVVVPDSESKAPRLEARDPRFALPGVKRKIGTVIDELSDMIFVHEMARDEAVRLGFAASTDADGEQLTSDVTVYEYVDDTSWAMVSATYSKVAKHNLGVVPAVYMQTFSPNMSGKSQFKEQISLMVATSRIITQKMAYMDRVIYPVTWVKGVEGEITLGPNSVTTLSADGEIGQLTPPTQLQVDRDLSTLERYQRILNRNPEVRQGEVDGKGAYVGAKTLESLNDSVDNSVARFWDAIQSGYEKLAAIALEMDEKMWPDEKKSYSVVFRGQRSVEEYTPSKDIDGRREIRVSYGFGVGGSYQSFLENVQAFQAELIPKRRAVEEMPGVQDANRILRELELDKIDNVAFEGFLAQAQQGQIDMVLWAKYRKKMETDGLAWHEAFIAYESEFQKQAAAAAEQPLPDQALTQPGAPGEGQPPGPPQAPQEQLESIPPPTMLGG